MIETLRKIFGVERLPTVAESPTPKQAKRQYVRASEITFNESSGYESWRTDANGELWLRARSTNAPVIHAFAGDDDDHGDQESWRYQFDEAFADKALEIRQLSWPMDDDDEDEVDNDE